MSSMVRRDKLRRRASEAGLEVAERLANPDYVASVALQSQKENAAAGSAHPPVWTSVGIAESPIGVALLHAEIAQTTADESHRARVKHHLATALSDAADLESGEGLFGSGAPALSMAATCAGTRTGDFSQLASQLDGPLIRLASRKIELCGSALARQGRINSNRDYDIVSGLAGIGRLLLLRAAQPTDRSDELTATLTSTIEIVTDIATASEAIVDGMHVPAWYSTQDEHAALANIRGYLDLGLAHGLAGPLALLAIARESGIRINRMVEAAEAIVSIYSRYRQIDELGAYWPNAAILKRGKAITLPNQRGRDAWCYGALGIARAMQLAGAAFERREWTEAAITATLGALRGIDRGAVSDLSLCHGWGGILHIIDRMAVDTGHRDLTDAAENLAELILGNFETTTPFGFRDTGKLSPFGADRPGYLEGAAGTALALLTFSRMHSTTPWDAPLLIS